MEAGLLGQMKHRAQQVAEQEKLTGPESVIPLFPLALEPLIAQVNSGKLHFVRKQTAPQVSLSNITIFNLYRELSFVMRVGVPFIDCQHFHLFPLFLSVYLYWSYPRLFLVFFSSHL